MGLGAGVSDLWIPRPAATRQAPLVKEFEKILRIKKMSPLFLDCQSDPSFDVISIIYTSLDCVQPGILFPPPMDGGGSDFEFPPQTLSEWGGWEISPPQTSPEWGGKNLDFFLQNTCIYQNFRRLRRAPIQYNYTKSNFSPPAAGFHTI